MLTYRKTKDGKWVAFGPVSEMEVGPVVVETKGGKSKEETVERLGRPFDVGGTPHCYGYLRPKRRYSGGSRSRRWEPCGYPGCSPDFCDECDGAGRYG